MSCLSGFELYSRWGPLNLERSKTFDIVLCAVWGAFRNYFSFHVFTQLSKAVKKSSAFSPNIDEIFKPQLLKKRYKEVACGPYLDTVMLYFGLYWMTFLEGS